MADQDLKNIFQAAAGAPDEADALKDDGKDLKDIFQAAHDSPSADEIQDQIAAAQPSLLDQGLTFAKNFPTSAIDLIPGMKDKREAIAAQRMTPQYQNAPSGVPGQTQGQLDQSTQAAGDNDFNNPIAGLVGPTSGYDLIKGVAGAASKLPLIGSSLEESAPALESTASKLAEESMGMNSSKGLTKKWNPETQSYDQGSDITKGVGTTALNQGVLDSGNTYDNALAALKNNANRLAPLFNATQSKIDSNLPQLMDQVGPLTTKTPQVVQKLLDEISSTSQEPRLVKLLTKQYQTWEPQLANADGNLQQLNTLKQQLTATAEKISPSVYNPNAPAPTTASKMEGALYKRLAGVVRQHIEDLADVADPGTGNQIKQINSNIGNINSMLPTLQAAQRVSLPGSWEQLGQAITGPIEKYAAKGLNAAAQGVNTPIGPIMQQVAPSVTRSLIGNPVTQSLSTPSTPSPWSQEKVQNKDQTNNNANSSPKKNVTRTASTLYNATDESLNDVADQLADKANMKYTSDYLKKAIADNDIDAKNRAIFLIMQSPQARSLVTPVADKNEEEV